MIKFSIPEKIISIKTFKMGILIKLVNFIILTKNLIKKMEAPEIYFYYTNLHFLYWDSSILILILYLYNNISYEGLILIPLDEILKA